jgi:hypothetical protein
MRPEDPAPATGAPDPSGSGAPTDSLDAAIDLCRRQLRGRAAVRLGAVGAWVGAGLAALWLAAWLLRWLPLPHFAWLLAPIVAVAAALAGFAAWRQRLDREELALLVDRVLGTDEVAVTALGLTGDAAPTGASSPLAPVVLAEAEAALDGAAFDLRARLALRWPRHLRWLPLALVVIAAMTMLPRAPIREKPAGPAGELASEADRLEQRRDQLERELGVELPDEIDEAFDELVEAMRNGSVGRSQAAEQAQELRDKLDEYASGDGDGAAQALRDAAESLERADPELAEDLKDALEEGDLEDAAEAVERMRERMEQRSPEERERAARELEQAAEQAMKSPLSGLGGALQGEADRMRKQGGSQGNQQGNQGAQQGGQQAGGQGNQGSQQGGQQGGQQQGGQQGGQQQGGQQQGGQQQGGSQTAGGTGSQQGGESGGEGGGQSGGGLAEYLEQLEEQGLGGDGLAEQEAQSELNQEMEQALGGAAGRMGEMEGAVGSQGAGGGGTGWGAGRGHTSEDEGTHSTQDVAHQDMDRQVDGRTSDWVVEFDQDHEPERLDGVEAVASTVDVPLGEGPVDVETFRLSGSEERAATPLIQAPAGYREAAEEAIEGEGIPRAYRDQVKQYFDAIE